MFASLYLLTILVIKEMFLLALINIQGCVIAFYKEIIDTMFKLRGVFLCMWIED